MEEMERVGKSRKDTEKESVYRVRFWDREEMARVGKLSKGMEEVECGPGGCKFTKRRKENNMRNVSRIRSHGKTVPFCRVGVESPCELFS